MTDIIMGPMSKRTCRTGKGRIIIEYIYFVLLSSSNRKYELLPIV